MNRRTMLALAWAAALTLVPVGPVLADDPIKEVADLGGVCQGLRWVDTETWVVTRTADGPQYPNAATLRVSVLDVADPVVATYEIFLTDDTIVLPADWIDQPADGTVTSLPDWWQYDYALTGHVEGGSGVIVVTWGVSVNDGPITPYSSALSIQVGAPCPSEEPTPTPAPTSAATPTVMDLTAILEVPKVDRFERFGGQPIRLRSVWSPPDPGLGGTCDPTDAWLECGLEDWLIQPSPTWDGPRLGLFFASGVRERLGDELRPGEGPLDVTGHFGDPAAEDCRPGDRDDCRDQFVVTAVSRGPAATPPATTAAAAVEPAVRPWDPIVLLIIAISATMLLIWRLPSRRPRPRYPTQPTSSGTVPRG